MIKIKYTPSTEFNTDKARVYFDTKHVGLPYINGLRRTLLSDTPCLAVTKIGHVHYGQDDVIPIETLAHQFGMMPVTSEPKSMLDKMPFQADCSCQSHCPLCSIYLKVNRCNIRTDGKLEAVTTRHAKDNNGYPVDQKTRFGLFSQEWECFVINIKPSESFNIDLVIQKGTPRTHVKWTPVTAVGITPRDNGLTVQSAGQMSALTAVQLGFQAMIQLMQKMGNVSNFKVL